MRPAFGPKDQVHVFGAIDSDHASAPGVMLLHPKGVNAGKILTAFGVPIFAKGCSVGIFHVPKYEATGAGNGGDASEIGIGNEFVALEYIFALDVERIGDEFEFAGNAETVGCSFAIVAIEGIHYLLDILVLLEEHVERGEIFINHA